MSKKIVGKQNASSSSQKALSALDLSDAKPRVLRISSSKAKPTSSKKNATLSYNWALKLVENLFKKRTHQMHDIAKDEAIASYTKTRHNSTLEAYDAVSKRLDPKKKS